MAKDDKAQRETDNPKKSKVPQGTTASGLGGAAIGAAVGTTAGPVGTLLGAVAGAVIGAGGSTFASGGTNKTNGNNKIVLGEGVTRDINGNLPGEGEDNDNTSETPSESPQPENNR